MAPLHSSDISLNKCDPNSYPDLASSCMGMYIYPLGDFNCFHFLIVPLIEENLLHLKVAPHRLILNCWRVLSSLLVLNHTLGINLCLEELSYLYEF